MSAVIPDIGLGATLSRRAQITPRRRAVTFEDQTWTYADFGDRIHRLAAALRAGGVGRGDRVGFVGLNHPVFLETLYASACLGAIFVPLNFRLTGPELEFIVNDAGIHTILIDDALTPTIAAQQKTLHCRRYIAAESPSVAWEHLHELLESHAPITSPESVDADDVAVIMYTSGTTGLPKGAMLTHGNLFWNTVNSFFTQTLPASVSLTCAPLFHIGGLNVTTLQCLASGNELILHRQFDPGAALRDIERYKVQSMFGAPAMFMFMAQQPEFADTDISSISALICGGAPAPLPLLEIYAERNITFCQGYGLTETAPFASLLTTDVVREKVGSAGLPPLFSELRIVDDQNQPLENQARGEVCIRGPNVMKGYWNRPDATADAIDDENWFHSGDIGYLDDDGFLFICDRVKDMVISGGENVYPAEVESVIQEHATVAEVAVIGLPDAKWGEAVTAIIVLAEVPGPTIKQLRDFCGEKLARYKLPLRLFTIDELPRNPAGKILKYKLKELYSEEQSAAAD